MSEQQIHDEEPISIEMEQLPERLKTSASLLCQTSILLQTAIYDEHRFALLTDPANTNKEAVEEVRNFDRLLVTALTALIDLTAYDNPEQEYPDLKTWFEFRCANVGFGKRTVTIST
jgi:hypothetical protein